MESPSTLVCVCVCIAHASVLLEHVVLDVCTYLVFAGSSEFS